MISADDVSPPSRFNSPSECIDFDCEDEDFVAFLHNEDQALQLQKDKTSVTYLFRLKTNNELIGFVSLAMGSVPKKSLPEEDREDHRFENVPCLLLGQMARHRKHYKNGVGEVMIDWVLAKANELSQVVGCRFILLNAKKEKMTHYQDHFDFEPLPYRKNDDTITMYFDLKTDEGEELQDQEKST